MPAKILELYLFGLRLIRRCPWLGGWAVGRTIRPTPTRHHDAFSFFSFSSWGPNGHHKPLNAQPTNHSQVGQNSNHPQLARPSVGGHQLFDHLSIWIFGCFAFPSTLESIKWAKATVTLFWRVVGPSYEELENYNWIRCFFVFLVFSNPAMYFSIGVEVLSISTRRGVFLFYNITLSSIS